MASTRDRKDKLLNKLYKRRVEIDFSRKGNSKTGVKSIASSLTCCQNCATVYLDLHVSSLICKKSAPVIDFRGKLVKRHQAVADWSLTAYLKSLHAASMSWEAIYWHVCGICTVFRYQDITFSASDSFRYTVETDGIVLTPSR